VLAGHAATAIAEVLDGTLRPEDCHSPLWRMRPLFVHPLMVRLFDRLLGIPDGIT
jgi:hypothetical protein